MESAAEKLTTVYNLNHVTDITEWSELDRDWNNDTPGHGSYRTSPDSMLVKQTTELVFTVMYNVT